MPSPLALRALARYWWCTEQMLTWPGKDGPDMLVDDGGPSAAGGTARVERVRALALKVEGIATALNTAHH